MNYENTHPKLETLEKWTGWERKKVIRVVNIMVDLGLMVKEHRKTKSGNFTSNNYKITTKLISYLKPMEGSEFTDYEDESTESQKGHTAESQKGNATESQNGTHNIVNSNSIYTTSLKENSEVEKNSWEPNPMYHQTAQSSCPDMDLDAFKAELIKFRLHYSDSWPKHPDKTWLSWCQRANVDYRQLKLRNQRVDEGDALAKERMHDFHSKKQENIKLVGSKPTNLPQGRKPVFKPYYRDYESREAYESAITEARQNGQIVETDQLPVNAAAYWGETRAPNVQNLYSNLNIKSIN